MCRSDAAKRYTERDHRSNVAAFRRVGGRSRLTRRFLYADVGKPYMPDLLLEIRISRGEPWRSVATGLWRAGGKLLLNQPTEPLPPRLITALDRHVDQFGPAIGTWHYTVGDANYQVVFSHYKSNVVN